MAHAAKSRIGRYESVYDLEEACFRHYREKMKSSLQTTGDISAEQWGQDHKLNRDEAIRGFDNNCGHFRKQDLVRNARASLLKRIETENMELIKLYELRIMNEAMQESLRESKAVTEESRATANKLNVVRKEQNKVLDENNARIAKLSSQQSNAREQHSKNLKTLADVEKCMAQLEHQRQEQEREQRELEEQARRNAQRLEELKRRSEEKKKSSFSKYIPTKTSFSWLFGSSKPQNPGPYSGHGTQNFPLHQESTLYPKHDQQTTNTQYHHHPANIARCPPVVVGSYGQQGFKPTPGHTDISVGPSEFPIDKSHTQLRGGGNFDTQTSPQSQGNDLFHNTSVTRNTATYVKGAGTDSKPELNDVNAVTPNLPQNDKFHSTSQAINPPTSEEGARADSKPKLDYKSSVVVIPIGADHTDNVENSFGAMTTRDDTYSSSGMKSKYDSDLVELSKLREQYTEPNPSQADTISENYDTLNDMQKNNNCSSRQVIVTHQIKFEDSENPENITHNLPATVIEKSQEVPETESKDVGNLINFDTDTAANVNSNTTIGTSDSLSTQTQQELSLIGFETNPETISLDENVRASENEMPPFDNNLLLPEPNLLADSTTVIQPITNEKHPKLQNTLGLALDSMKNLSALLAAKNAESDQNVDTVAQPENVDGSNQHDENIPLTQNQTDDNSFKEAEANGFEIVNLV